MPYTVELLCFSYTVACSSHNREIIKRLRYSNKILLPQTVLYNISQNEEQMKNKLYFKVSHKESGYGSVCGVHEFTAPPGVVHIPYHIMEECGIQEGSTVKVDLVCPVKGSFMKLRLHNSKDFSKLNNPKVVLEKYLSSDYPIVTENRTIALYYADLDKLFYIDIVETKPAPVIEILNTDINVDFDKALDAIDEPTKVSSSYPDPPGQLNEDIKITAGQETKRNGVNVSRNVKLQQHKTNNEFVPFSGKGNVLGSK